MGLGKDRAHKRISICLGELLIALVLSFRAFKGTCAQLNPRMRVRIVFGKSDSMHFAVPPGGYAYWRNSAEISIGHERRS